MNEYKVVVRNDSDIIFSEVIKAYDEREALGELLIKSELFGQSFTDIRITEI
ncbi:hypothetical protein [Neobacillus terrae]|uniref:hypothetical protein n=1 Tax=Neobacillus terrae TaxID=3034837 RepID=UPI0014092403|nr:hypothetical protein [Neobacillus terrae]NHM31645.1 hypothetical protein [Neobacillus terrae]